jgi:hypothetical protein
MDIPSAALFSNRTQMVFANSTYINNPSFWPSAGQEQDLGDGTFGRRFTGSFTQAADVLLQSVLTTAVTNANARIIKSGGWFDVGPNHAQVGQYLTLGATTWWSALYTQPTGVVLNTFVSSARSAAAYDVWIRYWKVPPP